MYKTGHAFTYLLLKEFIADDVINVSLVAGSLAKISDSHIRR